jgi:hypothetical protein
MYFPLFIGFSGFSWTFPVKDAKKIKSLKASDLRLFDWETIGRAPSQNTLYKCFNSRDFSIEKNQ